VDGKRKSWNGWEKRRTKTSEGVRTKRLTALSIPERNTTTTKEQRERLSTADLDEDITRQR
jgi:hypothetical protein